jgi:energy-converting hydrogenase A subunit R
MAEKVICFDLEGPLSPQDNAYEVMGLLLDGHRIFEVLSLYDDILTLEGRRGYEPGDTLSLIVPFLVYHRMKEADIRKVSDTAKIVDGVPYVISRLEELGWTPHIISTSYRQHAHNIGAKIGVPEDRIHATSLPLDSFSKRLPEEERLMVEKLEEDILKTLYPSLGDEKQLKERLDAFYYGEVEDTVLGELMSKVSVVGGQRKVDAAEAVSEAAGVSLSETVVVGDSITDYKMLGRVREEGGVAVAFNGNRYAIPYSNVGLATTDMRFLLVVIAAHMRAGARGALEAAAAWEMRREEFMAEPGKIPKELIPEDVRKALASGMKEKGFFGPRFHLLSGAGKEKLEAVAKIHSESRALVRGAAAKLG